MSELGAGEACNGTRRAANPPSAGRSLNLRPLCCTAEDQLIEPPDADPLVRWCGRGGAVRPPPIPIRYGCCGFPSLTLLRSIVRRRGEIICRRVRRSGESAWASEFSVGSPQLNVCVALRASGLARISHRRLDSPEFKVWRSRGGPGGPQDSRSGDRRYDFRQRARNAGSSGNGMAFPC